MDAFPAFVPLAGARVVIAGEGEAAEAKARLFEGSPAELVRLTGDAALRAESYAGARLAFVAGEEDWTREAVAAARAAGAWVNAVDRPALCDFNTPGIVDRGAVVGAVGTVGAAPVLAVRLRQEIEARWPARLGGLARLMGALRPAIRAATQDWAARRAMLAGLMAGPWAEAALAGEAERAEVLAKAALAVGELAASPGALAVLRLPAEPDLMTLRDARVLGVADRVVTSGEVPEAILALARRDAPRESWTTDEAVAAHVASGERVVVLAAAGAPAPDGVPR